MKSRFLLVLGVSALAESAFSASPSVTWVSYPVGSGDHVLVHGSDWGTGPKAEIGGKTVPLAVLSDSAAVFPFPPEESVVRGRIVGAGGRSEPFVLNAPTVWWMQGDRGDASSPGGTLRVFGRSLAPYGKGVAGKPRLKVGDRELALTKADVWSLDAAVPKDLAPGTYKVRVRNGLKGEEGWTEAGDWKVEPDVPVWKADVFPVTRFGAGPNDGDSDSDAFDAAMAAAERNGGGIVYVPCGRYVLTRTLAIPPRVLLKGEALDLAQICWPDMDDPPENLIEGTHSFGIHDLFISSGRCRNGIVAKSEASGKGDMFASREAYTHDVSLRRLRVKLVSDQWRDSRDGAHFLARYRLKGNGIVVRNCLRAEMTDCEIYNDKDAQRTLHFIFTGPYVRMANCSVSGSGWSIFGGDRCIFENNSLVDCTASISAVCSRMFWSGNRHTDVFNNNREAMTHDGGNTAFKVQPHGALGCCTGTAEGRRLRLVYPPKVRWHVGEDGKGLVGMNVLVADGKGVGQTRTIVAAAGREEVELDRPFGIAPDATSRFAILTERRHLLYVDNEAQDAGIAIQLYGDAVDCVIARNRCRRAGGFVGSGRDYGGFGVLPCWYLQFLGNVVEEGNCHRGALGTDYAAAGGSVIGAFKPNVPWPFSQSYVIRDNEIRSNGSIFVSVKNALIERNAVRRSDVGISSLLYQDTMYVSDNVFDRVLEPYANLAAAKISPPYRDDLRERALAGLRAGSFDSGNTRLVRLAFGLDFRVPFWQKDIRAAFTERELKPFDYPVSLVFKGALSNDIRAVSVRVPDAGGWTFGGEVKLVRGKCPGIEAADGETVFSGKVRVTPPATPPIGMFPWMSQVRISGEGWSVGVKAQVMLLPQYRLLRWRFAHVASGAQPTPDQWKPFPGPSAMDVHESVIPAKLLGADAEKGDLWLETRIRVNRKMRFGFVRGDFATYLFVDGRELFRPEDNLTDPKAVNLEPGVHVIRLRRNPADARRLRTRPDAGMFIQCRFPDGCLPGDWVQE